jgi:predicted DNA-binding transcriptional regulator
MKMAKKGTSKFLQNYEKRIVALKTYLDEELQEVKERVAKLEEITSIKRSTVKDESKIPYRKGTSQYFVYLLISMDKFFENQIRTTGEIVKRVKIKYDKTIDPRKAAQLFATLVKDGYLERDIIETRGRGEYIWFLPTTPKEKIEEFKKRDLEETINEHL